MGDAGNNGQSTVLIVGAGPVGLTLANALGMNVSSQYGYELLGMRQFLGRAGQRVRRANVLWRAKRISGIEFKRTGFHIDSLLAQPQADTERELFEALEHVGQTVQWRTRVLAVAQQADWVEAVLEDSASQQFTRRFAYAIGCDGKYSVCCKRGPAWLANYAAAARFDAGRGFGAWGHAVACAGWLCGLGWCFT